jgi:hypothetical protein
MRIKRNAQEAAEGHIHDHAGAVGLRDLSHMTRPYLGPEQVASHHALPDEIVAHTDEDEDTAAERRCRVDRPAVEIFGEKRCRERDEAYQEQQEAVGIEKALVHPSNEVEQAVVIDPHDQDYKEAEEKGKIGRPEVEKRLGKDGRRADLEDEKRDRDGEHAIAECLNPSGLLLGHGDMIPDSGNAGSRDRTLQQNPDRFLRFTRGSGEAGRSWRMCSRRKISG